MPSSQSSYGLHEEMLDKCIAQVSVAVFGRRAWANARRSPTICRSPHPIRALCTNAGVDGGVVVKEVLSSKGNVGYNVATDKFEDLVKAGVVDPTKVTRTALQNAASIAGLLLTTECMITEIPEKKEAAGGGGHGHGPGGGGMDY